MKSPEWGKVEDRATIAEHRRPQELSALGTALDARLLDAKTLSGQSGHCALNLPLPLGRGETLPV